VPADLRRYSLGNSSLQKSRSSVWSVPHASTGMSMMKSSQSNPRSTNSALRTLRSDDGAVSFTLARTSTGVFVERVQLRRGQGRIVLSTVFTDNKSFERWCDADSMRFDYPLVYLSLKRDGYALLRRDE